MNDKPEKVKSKKASLVPAVRQKGTLAPPDPFNAYLQEAKRYPLLTEEEEKEEVKKKEKTIVMITLTVFFLTVIIIVVKIYFPKELDMVLEYIKQGASFVFNKVITSSYSPPPHFSNN